MRLPNIEFREIELPKQFRSDMYLVSKSGHKSAVRDRVKGLVIEVLAPFRDPGRG